MLPHLFISLVTRFAANLHIRGGLVDVRLEEMQPISLLRGTLPGLTADWYVPLLVPTLVAQPPSGGDQDGLVTRDVVGGQAAATDLHALRQLVEGHGGCLGTLDQHDGTVEVYLPGEQTAVHDQP